MMTSSKTTDTPSTRPKPKVLELRGVTFSGKSDRSAFLSDVTFQLREGEMLMLHLDRSQKSRETSSMIQGLQTPTRGDVLFQDADWKGSDFDRHFRMRGRIGRVFEDQAWIENLNMLENLTLASLHHGRPLVSTMKDLKTWAERFGLDEASRERPAFVEPSRLQMYQWLRALVGTPALLLLERPMQSVASSCLPKLVDAINEVRRRGTAVLWFAGNAADAAESFIEPISHFRLSGGVLQPVTDQSESAQSQNEWGGRS